MASSATLATLRARVRTQLEGASGFQAPLAITASSITLTQIRTRIELQLQDSGNEKWAEADVDEALTAALDRYSLTSPQEKVGTVTVSTAGREQSISTLTGIQRVLRVWWDYDSSTPGFPPNWRQFQVWPGSILFIDDPDEPAVNDVLRIWYTLAHTIESLAGATATTVPQEDVGALINGACYYAATQRAIKLSETLNVDRDVVKRLTEWGEAKRKGFSYEITRQPPAWQRHQEAFDQGDIDEAVTWALHRYSEINPQRNIDSLTLAADGREVDISSLTGLIDVQRVWWNYNSTDPAYPPDWRDFEVWPGDILYVKDGGEPKTSDVVRVWYTLPQALNGLSGATATTYPGDADSLLVAGAAGYAAQERVQEQPGRYAPRKLREWSAARIREFERGLRAVARREAARASGVAPGPALDRWDTSQW